MNHKAKHLGGTIAVLTAGPAAIPPEQALLANGPVAGDVAKAFSLPPVAPIDDPARLQYQLDQWLEQAFEPLWAPLIWPSLIGLCAELRARLPDNGWERVKAIIAAHDITLLAQEEPLTRLGVAIAAANPAERMPDPALIDLATGHPGGEPLRDAASVAGRALHDVIAAMPLATAWLDQQRVIARVAESLAERERSPSFLTLDAGHLREASMARSFRPIERWVAQESDPAALALLQAEQKEASLPCFAAAIRPRRGTGPLLRGGPEARTRFNLITMPRSLARMNDRQARSMIAQAFDRLAPGGVLIASSLAKDLPEAAYLEAFMGWKPIRRDIADMAALLEPLPGEECIRREVARAPSGGLLHLLAVKRL